MNTKAIDSIAKAVLYEGYMLYPYRPSSVKNRQRFNFGVLYPRSYSEAQSGSDAWSSQTECLVEGSSLAAMEIRVRFLKLVARITTLEATAANGQPTGSWQEAIECDVVIPVWRLGALLSGSLSFSFSFPAKQDVEISRDSHGEAIGRILRTQEFVQGTVQVIAEQITNELFKVRIVVENLTVFDHPGEPRHEALMRSLVSAHILMGVTEGRFISLLDPPKEHLDLAASCRNIGTWPVLVGAEGQGDTMLSSPIILYDYPQIAPESPGDLFDGAEIDEILSLRILTMTDDEKNEMRQSDERARRMLERTESLPMEHLMRLHGTLRELRPLKEEAP